MLENNLKQAKPTLKAQKLKALIGPHAGYEYSGPNAAWAYKAITDVDSYDRVFILGPSHKVFLDFIATTSCDQWETPLGSLEIDKELVDRLVSQKEAEFSLIQKSYEENEHSLEMHLPYIRKVFESRMGSDNDIKIVPLMVGEIDKDQMPKYAQALKPYFDDDRNLFVISSDFCHWGEDFDFTHKYPEIEDKEIYKSIQKLDLKALVLIEKHELTKFQAYLEKTKNTICGQYPI